MKVSQKEATINALISVLASRGINFKLNKDAMAQYLTQEDKRIAKQILVTGFKLGLISFKDSFSQKVSDDKELKRYVCGLVSNWLRKSKELNCGESDCYYTL